MMQGLLSSLLKQIGCKAPVSFPHGNKNHLQTNKIDMNTNHISMKYQQEDMPRDDIHKY